jgi:hypothetical protein
MSPLEQATETQARADATAVRVSERIMTVSSWFVGGFVPVGGVLSSRRAELGAARIDEDSNTYGGATLDGRAFTGPHAVHVFRDGESRSLSAASANVVAEPKHPIAEPANVVAEPKHPIAEPANVVAEPKHPIAEPANVVAEPKHPIAEPANVVAEPKHPIAEPANVVAEPKHPIAEPANVVAEPKHPIAEPANVVEPALLLVAEDRHGACG